MTPRPPLIQPGRPICHTSDLRNGQSLKFQFPTGIGPEEAFLVRYGDQYHAYVNRCRHVNIPLDYDDNDFFSTDGEYLVCKNHGAVYIPDTGECACGPCDGRSLLRLPVLVQDSQVILGEIPAHLRV
ncbi:MAG TPA: Rieske 2Fe-2S domain-containing protein [Acidobacteriota bacterium]|nr:Rieske 2Fe-2S domain-containing protein [Acidobacteriota bacterium]